MSYGELNRRANQLGSYLQGQGVGPEVVVGLCLERSVEMIVALLGVLKAGGAYLPLDPELPLERLGYMLEDAGVGVVLTQRRLEKRLPSFFGMTVLMDEEWERIGAESGRELESGVVAGNLAYVIYTSGSTGEPKGVMVQHRSMVNCRCLDAERIIRWSKTKGFLLQRSLNSILAVWEICLAAVGGAGACDVAEVATDGKRIDAEYRGEQQSTSAKIVPSKLRTLLNEQTEGEPVTAEADLWRRVVIGETIEAYLGESRRV